MASRREVGSSGSSSCGFISPKLKCNCGNYVVVQTVKNGPNVGMKFYRCPKWPWVNWNMDNSDVNKDVEDVRLRLLEKDTIIGEKEIEINFMKETLKKVELKLESKDEELKETKMGLSCTRIELMKASRNENNFSLALLEAVVDEFICILVNVVWYANK
ncbi:DNA topoisomerase 3-alpha [Bienertia sinuspersici]